MGAGLDQVGTRTQRAERVSSATARSNFRRKRLDTRQLQRRRIGRTRVHHGPRGPLLGVRRARGGGRRRTQATTDLAEHHERRRDVATGEAQGVLQGDRQTRRHRGIHGDDDGRPVAAGRRVGGGTGDSVGAAVVARQPPHRDHRTIRQGCRSGGSRQGDGTRVSRRRQSGQTAEEQQRRGEARRESSGLFQESEHLGTPGIRAIRQLIRKHPSCSVGR